MIERKRYLNNYIKKGMGAHQKGVENYLAEGVGR